MASFALIDDDGYGSTDGDMVVREECPAPCCDGSTPPCYWRFDGCPPQGNWGECAVSAPPVYLPCGALCADGSPITDRVVTINTTGYAGWCWRRTDDCRYTEGPDVPDGWCLLPPDAVVVSDGIVCVSNCDDPVCSRRGTYLVPTICEGTCGPEDHNILVCPTENADLSYCQYIHVSSPGYCGCIVVGPHSREFTGDPTGYTIVENDGQWFAALDPQTACCECCGKSPCSNMCKYNRIAPPANSKQAPYCFDKFYPEGVACCCGLRWRTVSVAIARYNQVNQQNYGNFFRSELLETGWSMVTFEHHADGSSACVGARALLTTFEQERTNGEVSYENYQTWPVESCEDAAFEGGTTTGCLIRGADMIYTSYPLAYDPLGRRNIWGQVENMMHAYALAVDFNAGGPGKCAGDASAVFGNCAQVGCFGSYAVSGGCQIGRAVGEYGEHYVSQNATTDTRTTLRAVVYRVVLDQQDGCGGGCGGKQPRDLIGGGAGAGGMAGAGDLL